MLKLHHRFKPVYLLQPAPHLITTIVSALSPHLFQHESELVIVMLFATAGHYLNRARVIALACFLWAACTALFAVSTSLRMGMIVWAFNGVGLALMIPNG